MHGLVLLVVSTSETTARLVVMVHVRLDGNVVTVMVVVMMVMLLDRDHIVLLLLLRHGRLRHGRLLLLVEVRGGCGTASTAATTASDEGLSFRISHCFCSIFLLKVCFLF